MREAGQGAKNYVGIFTSTSPIGHRTRNPSQDRKWVCRRVSDSPRGTRCNRPLSIAHLSSDAELKSHDRGRVCSSQWCTGEEVRAADDGEVHSAKSRAGVGQDCKDAASDVVSIVGQSPLELVALAYGGWYWHSGETIFEADDLMFVVVFIWSDEKVKVCSEYCATLGVPDDELLPVRNEICSFLRPAVELKAEALVGTDKRLVDVHRRLYTKERIAVVP